MKCSHCDEKAILFLPYATRHLCEQHFLRMFDKRFRLAIRQFKMIKKGERIAVGLSGGKDSCVLLHSLHELQRDLPFELVAITIDEGIKNYRSRTLKIAKNLCKELSIEQVVLSFKKQTGKNLDSIVKKTKTDLPCSYCGVIRRYLLNKGAKQVAADKLAIGHNLDDIAQTVFMNIMRNEPARLARFLNPSTGGTDMVTRIRPLLKTPEKEVAIYAMLKNIAIDHVECPYAHFAFRSQVRRILNDTEEKYPGTKFKIVNSFLDMEDGLKHKYSKSKFSFCKNCGEASSTDECKFCSMLKELLG